MASFKNILVPTDFSENASNVFGYVRWLSEQYDSRVDLIHVIPKMTYLEISEEVMGNPFKMQEKYEELRVKLKNKLETEMEKHISKKNRGKVFVSGEVKVSRGIKEHSQETPYDLIVIGSRGKNGSIFKRGGVTQRLIRLSSTPVLSFNKEIAANIKTILMPTDGSRASFEALSVALDFAKRSNARIELFSVIEFDFDKVKLVGGDTSLWEIASESQKKDILNNLKGYIDQTEGYSFKEEPTLDGCIIHCSSGKKIEIDIQIEHEVSVHHRIVKHADKYAELVVMTTHGRSGLAKLLIGSVAEKVVRHLDIPVLTIKPEFAK